MKHFIIVFSATALFAFYLPVLASVPTGGGTLPFFGVPDTDGAIKGVRVNPGWGMHKTVYGLDLGLVGNSTLKDFVGIGMAAGFNTTDGKAVVTGLQLAGVLNRNAGRTHVGGLQVAVGVNSSPGDVSVYGAQIGVVANVGKNTVYGFQIGSYNSAEFIAGFQMGLYNEAKEVNGFQFGIINKAKNLNGIQLGLANFHEKGLPFSPFINIGF